MRTKLLSLIILAAVTIVSCGKEQVIPGNNSSSTGTQGGNSNAVGTAPTGASPALEGKWQLTKLVSYLDSAGRKMDDTTYLSPFNANDYALFSAASTCALSISHYFYYNIPGTSTTPTPITPSVSDFFVQAAGSKFVLTSQSTVVGPGGGWRTDTVSMQTNNTLVLHSVFSGFGPSTHLFISDSYYTKINGN